MPRSLSAFLMLAALAGVGCKQEGTLRVTWAFAGNEPASSGCGRHGVDSIVISGADGAGDGLLTQTSCTPGVRDVTVAPGTWTVQVALFLPYQGVGVDAGPLPPSATGMAVVTTDVPGAVSVELQAPAACSDHVDNDGDGRVDQADPGCQDGGTQE